MVPKWGWGRGVGGGGDDFAKTKEFGVIMGFESKGSGPKNLYALISLFLNKSPSMCFYVYI